MGRRAAGPVISGIQVEDGPGPGRVAGPADRDVNVGRARECAAGWIGLEREDGVEPAIGLRVVETPRVGHEGTCRAAGSVDRGRIPEEGIEGLRPRHDLAVGVVHGQHVVDCLEDEAIADAQTLVRGFQAELVAAARGPRVEVAQAVETGEVLVEPRDGLGHGIRDSRRPEHVRCMHLRLRRAFERIGLRDLRCRPDDGSRAGRLGSDRRGCTLDQRHECIRSCVGQHGRRGAGHERRDERNGRDDGACTPGAAPHKMFRKDHHDPPVLPASAPRYAPQHNNAVARALRFAADHDCRSAY